MKRDHVKAIQESFCRRRADDPNKRLCLFYGRLFEIAPDLKLLFVGILPCRAKIDDDAGHRR